MGSNKDCGSNKYPQTIYYKQSNEIQENIDEILCIFYIFTSESITFYIFTPPECTYNIFVLPLTFSLT